MRHKSACTQSKLYSPRLCLLDRYDTISSRMPFRGVRLNQLFTSSRGFSTCQSSYRRHVSWCRLNDAPSCTNRSLPNWLGNGCEKSRLNHHSRQLSSGSILNAVHAVRSIPQEFKELDDALDVVERDAGVYADLNQLRLIRRGLESHNAITRVAGLYYYDLSNKLSADSFSSSGSRQSRTRGQTFANSTCRSACFKTRLGTMAHRRRRTRQPSSNLEVSPL